jgi:hypothetical protein
MTMEADEIIDRARDLAGNMRFNEAAEQLREEVLAANGNADALRSAWRTHLAALQARNATVREQVGGPTIRVLAVAAFHLPRAPRRPSMTREQMLEALSDGQRKIFDVLNDFYTKPQPGEDKVPIPAGLETRIDLVMIELSAIIDILWNER